jgi:hypothetical protein
METAIELKEKLIEKIENTDNVQLLRELDLFIEFEAKAGEVYEMCAEEFEAVNDGLDQLKNGRRLSHEESNKHVDQWLKKSSVYC